MAALSPDRERADLVRNIEGLWPADDPDPSTSRIGRELLDEAKANVCGWRTEPLEVLREYNRLSISRDNATAGRTLRRDYE